jgi:hypothetical protein
MLTFDEICMEYFKKEMFDRDFEKGFKIGIEKGLRELLLRQLVRRFGDLPEAIAGRVARAGAEELARWNERLLDAVSLDDVFAAP